MSPSRSAHGQISRLRELEHFQGGLGHQGAGQELGRARFGDTGKVQPVLHLHGRDPLRPDAQVRGVQLPLDVGSGGAGRGTGNAGQGPEGLGGAGHQVGRAQALEFAHRGLERGPDVAAQLLDALGRRRVLGQPVAGEPAGAQRDRRRQLGQFVLAEGHFKGAAADVQVQDGTGAPAVPAAHGEERHGRLFAAGEFLERHGGLVLDPGQDAAPLVASRMAEVQNASRSSALCVAANSHASRTNSISSCWPASLMLPSAIKELNEGQRPLVRGERDRAGAGVGVHQEEVDGVGPDVEDA